jgi:hypothetical protein
LDEGSFRSLRMMYKITASHIASPKIAAGKCDSAPAVSLTTKVHATLKRILALITANPNTSDLFQKARANAVKLIGISKATRILARVHSPVRYSSSAASISITAGLGFSGAGNQNMLVASADEGDHDAPKASPVREVAERQQKEGPYVPAQDVVVARPSPREEPLQKLHRLQFHDIRPPSIHPSADTGLHPTGR